MNLFTTKCSLSCTRLESANHRQHFIRLFFNHRFFSCIELILITLFTCSLLIYSHLVHTIFSFIITDTDFVKKKVIENANEHRSGVITSIKNVNK